MGNILWSVDKKIYSDKEDHTLAITGWAITRDQSECDFILYGSGKELFVPEPSRCERADVAKDLKETMVKLIKYMRRFYVPIVMVIIFAIASTVFNIVGPTILGDSTGLSPFWVVFAIMVGGGLFGFAGMLLGVPVFAVIYYIIQRVIYHFLRKRKLPEATEQYIELDKVDTRTNELCYFQKEEIDVKKEDQTEENTENKN